jgi:spore maturation protein CgeB
MMAILLPYKAITVNSPMLYEMFKDKHDHVFYAPRGVNTKLFVPEDKKTYTNELRVGWAGSLTNHPGKRGYYDFIVPAIEKMDGVVLETAAREEKWRTQKEMVEFYHSLDAYICASWTEGTPNPALEAASCGLPIVTTRVGNMPELIKDGYNGIFIERDINSIISALTKLRDDRELAAKMGERNREEILKNWSWEKQVENYDRVFEFILQNDE